MKISMKLIPNWREVLRWAWSVRFILASIVCDVLGIGLAVAGAMGVQEHTNSSFPSRCRVYAQTCTSSSEPTYLLMAALQKHRAGGPGLKAP